MERMGNPSLAETLGTIREKLGQQPISVGSLRAEAGNSNPRIAEQARILLNTKWNLSPGKDSENATTVDVVEQLSKFTEEERKTIVSQMAGLQLTKGCNGECSFCAFGKHANGVEEKYSFKSLDTFFNTYKDLIGKDLVLYWNSDPFDYRDGERNFTDVYRLWRGIKPEEKHYVSTAIPRGSQSDFVDFMQYVMQEQKEKGISNPDLHPMTKIRVSVAEHNIQRIEGTFKILTETLLSKGYSQEEIDHFYDTCVLIEGRFNKSREMKDNLGVSAPLGQLIKLSDPFSSIFTPACRDGVIIAPDSCKAVMVTAPTIYEPSGEKDIELLPGKVMSQVPLRNNINSDQRFFQSENEDKKRVMLDLIRTVDGNEYALSDQTEDLILKLGRDISSMGRLIESLSAQDVSVDIDPNTNTNPRIGSDGIRNYIEFAIDHFLDREGHMRKQLSIAKKQVKSGSLSAEKLEKLNYYILLGRAYFDKANCLISLADMGFPNETIKVAANALNGIGKNQIDMLPEIKRRMRLVALGRMLGKKMGMRIYKANFLSKK